jgi:sulfite reductase (ferredoxin)
LNNGNITAASLAGVAQIAKELGSEIRTTQLQDMLICGVAEGDVVTVSAKVKELGIDVGVKRPKVVSCTGAGTCKLGLCLSRGLADAIGEKLKGADAPDELIRISGCPNSCGHHSVASIGFQGRGKRVDGRLVPSYDVFAGAKMYQGQAKLGERIGTVPAKRIPDMVAEAIEKKATTGDAFKEVLARYDSFAPDTIGEDFYYDFGSGKLFSMPGK